MPKAAARTSTAAKKGGRQLKSVVTAAASTEALVDLVQKLGLTDILMDRVKARIEEQDFDEIFDEVTDYLRRNPEVLVVTLGAVTAATALIVWLNSRREWDGKERRERSLSRA
jgi:hypothetical protein